MKPRHPMLTYRPAGWYTVLGITALLGLTIMLLSASGAVAQSPPPSPTPDHGAHHGGDGPTATPTQSASGMGGHMMSTATPMHDMGGMMGGDGGHDMGPIDPAGASPADANARGGQRLEPRLVDGVKEFTLIVQKVLWNILPDVQVVAYTYNGTVPGPEIRVTAGDRVRILVTNLLDEATSVHWHGMQIPNDQDGAADVTQPPIKPGETYTYEWIVPDTPGSYFYHTHYRADIQQTLGLYGALIVEPRQPHTTYDVDYTILLGEWTIKDKQTYPAMDMDGLKPNYFTINGKSYPHTEVINVRVGQRVLLRLIGSGQFIHPMHLHGHAFKIVGTDGNPVPEAAQLTKDTVLLGPGERYDLEFTAQRPGKWLFHCHINHHVTNDGQEVAGGGGLVMVFNVIE